MTKPHITGTTHTLPFDKLSPREFERLCLWLVEREGYARAEHLGAAGSDQGYDVVARRGDRLWAFQCKRVKRFGPTGALTEVEKVLSLPQEQRPANYVFVVACDVSTNTRQQVRARLAEEKVECHFWAGTELDEKVKRHESIVEEFFRGPAPIAPRPRRDQERDDRFDNLIACSSPVPIFTQGQSRLTTTMVSNALIVDFSNGQTWSGVAFVFTPVLNVRGFTHLELSATASQDFKFQMEYKVCVVGEEPKVVAESAFHRFPATMQVSTVQIPLSYSGTVDEITLMFYVTGEASTVTIESIRLSK